MTTTINRSAVASESITGESLVARLLAPGRRLNRASQNATVNQLERSIACGKALPIAMITAVIDDQLRRGCPAEEVARFADDLKRYTFERARTLKPVCHRSLRQLLLAEARAEGLKNCAEVELHADPGNAVLREKFLAAAAVYREADAALTSAVQQGKISVEDVYPTTARAPLAVAVRVSRTTVPA